MRRRFDDVPNRAPFYSENKYNKNWDRATGGLSYQDAYEQNAIGCHGTLLTLSSEHSITFT